MKNKKRVLSVVLVGSILLSTSFTVYAESQKKDVKQVEKENIKNYEMMSTGSALYTKNENVYASLAVDGTASEAYVINHFSVENAGRIVDYGRYGEIKNLSTLNNLKKENNRIDFKVDTGEFYYQGQMKNVELPWKFAISYKLDGKPVTADELAGRSGKLEIVFETTKNNKADEIFYDNYLMQVSVNMDSEKVKNIIADGATIADAGANRQISFTALPGSDAEFIIKADATDFTMSGFSIAAVPYSMNIDMDQFNMNDFSGQISELTDAVDKLNDGASGLSEGMDKLCAGNEALLDGSKEIQQGLDTLSSNSADIIKASSKIKKALNKMSVQLGKADFSGMSNFSKLPTGLNKLANALDDISTGLKTLESNYATAFTTLDQMIQVNTNVPTESELNALQQCVKNNEDAASAYQKLLSSYRQILTIDATYQKIKPAFQAVQTTLNSENEQSVINGINTVSKELRSMAKSLSTLSKTDIAGQMKKLKKGVSTLATQYGKFNTGLSSYTGGVDTLSKNYGTFHKGVSSYLVGTEKIKGGTTKLSDGTEQFADGISDMPTQIQDTIDEMVENFSGDDYQAVSFTNKKNEHIASVQFVISTKGIEKTGPDKMIETEKKQNFWDRLKTLFVR